VITVFVLVLDFFGFDYRANRLLAPKKKTSKLASFFASFF